MAGFREITQWSCADSIPPKSMSPKSPGTTPAQLARMRMRILVCTGTASLAAMGCGGSGSLGGTTSPPAVVIAGVDLTVAGGIQRGDTIVAPVGDSLVAKVRVHDANGGEMSGQTVSWVVTPSNAALSIASAVLRASGPTEAVVAAEVRGVRSSQVRVSFRQAPSRTFSVDGTYAFAFTETVTGSPHTPYTVDGQLHIADTAHVAGASSDWILTGTAAVTLHCVNGQQFQCNKVLPYSIANYPQSQFATSYVQANGRVFLELTNPDVSTAAPMYISAAVKGDSLIGTAQYFFNPRDRMSGTFRAKRTGPR